MFDYKAKLLFLVCIVILSACQKPTTTEETEDSIEAVEENPLKAQYSKREVKIPMRDGVKLFTSIYTPKDVSEDYPILIWRTPYCVCPYGEDEYREKIAQTKHLVDEKFIFVFQDVRGRFMSEGEYVNMRPYIADKKDGQIDESSDAYDTVDWLIKNVEGHNGNVGMWGISYPGFYAAMGAIDAHSAIKAISPQAPIADWFAGDDFHHNGAFFSLAAFSFMSVFGLARPEQISEWPKGFDFPTPDGYQFHLDAQTIEYLNKNYLKEEISFWNECMEHGTYDDFWKARSSLPHFNKIRPAMLIVGGWFDAENLYGALKTYQSIEEKNPAGFNVLVMGPWYHGGWVRAEGDFLGDVQFKLKTGEYYKNQIELPFFRHYLKGGPLPELSEATVFETGSNVWKTYPEWPPKAAKEKKLYLHKGGHLSFSVSKISDATGTLFDEYISDPAKPVPYSQEIRTRPSREFMVEDQRFAGRRPDVLVYTSEPLKEDLTVVGPIIAQLLVSSSTTDSDWIVKVIDVYPGNVDGGGSSEKDVNMGDYQMLLRAEVMRGKFRNSLENPEPFVPEQITELSFELPDVNHTFLEGHKIMVQIQSTWFPLIDRNPQKFMDIYHAEPKDFQKAVQRVYGSKDYPSALLVKIMD